MGNSPGKISLYLLESFRELFEHLEFQLELFVYLQIEIDLWTDLPCVSDDLNWRAGKFCVAPREAKTFRKHTKTKKK